MTDEPEVPAAPKANKVYVVGLSATAITVLGQLIVTILGLGSAGTRADSIDKSVNGLSTAVAILQVQGAQQNQTLNDIRATLMPLTDGERERLKMEKVVRDLVKDEALKK